MVAPTNSPEFDAAFYDKWGTLEENRDKNRRMAVAMEQTRARYGGRTPSKIVVEYKPDCKVTTRIYPNGDKLIIEEPGITVDNGWIYALLRQHDAPIEAYCRIQNHLAYQPLGPCRLRSTDPNRLSEVRRHAFDIFKGRCAKCDKDALVYGFHIDHHLPKSKGYALTRTNAVLLCPSCNSSKRAKLPSKFYSPAELERVERILLENAQ